MNRDEQGYQGWTNYETWCVKLWIDNEYRLYEAVRKMVEIVTSMATSDAAKVAKLEAAVRVYIESEKDVTNVTDNASFVSDLLGHALGACNWREIAENLLGEQ